MSNIASTLAVFGEVGSEEPIERTESFLARVLRIGKGPFLFGWVFDCGSATGKSAIVFTSASFASSASSTSHTVTTSDSAC